MVVDMIENIYTPSLTNNTYTAYFKTTIAPLSFRAFKITLDPEAPEPSTYSDCATGCSISNEAY